MTKEQNNHKPKFCIVSFFKNLLPKTFGYKKLLPIIVLAVICMFTIDRYSATQIEDIRKLDKFATFDSIMETLTHLGKSEYYIVPCVLLIIAGYVFKYKKYDRPLFFATLSVAVSGLFIHIPKIIFGRHRPDIDVDFNQLLFHPFRGFVYDWSSMPSGHSCTAGAVATVLCFLIPKYKYLWIIYAVIIAATRIWIQSHFPSDTMIGLAVGAIITLKIRENWFPNDNLKIFG